jgi:hypothetical protein
VLNSDNEIWKPVKEFPELYKVSNLGRVASYRKILAVNVLNSGYLSVQFKIAGNNVNRLVHRLVAEAFIENPENKKEVNHKNGEKTLNIPENLEWVTSSENKLHALNSGLKTYNKPSTGIKLGGSSEYHNVSYDNTKKQWKASVRFNGKDYGQKRFNSEVEAALHVNKVLDELQLFDRPRNIIR